MGHGVGRFDGRYDTLGACQILKCVHGFVVRNCHILGAADIMQPRVLRADAGIIQTGGDGVNRRDLTVLILAEIGLHAVENAQTARIDGGCSLEGVDAAACGLTADQAHIFIIDEIVEAANGVGAAAHAGNDGVRQVAFLFQHLLLDLLGNNRLKITHGCGPITEPRQ